MSKMDLDTRRRLLLEAYGLRQWHWVLRRGVLGWGTTMFIFFVVPSFFIPGMRPLTSPGLLITTAIICASGGLIFGFFTWRFSVAKPAEKLMQS
jgi:hypothetical protein